MKEWSLTGASVALLIFGAIQWGGYWEFRGNTNATLTNLREGLSRVEQKLRELLSLRAQQASTQPNRPENQTAATQLLAEAKQKSISIAPEVLEQTGKSFINAARRDPKAWEVALDFLSYRSSAFRHKVTGIPLPSEKITLHFDLGSLVPGKPAPHLERLTRSYVASNEAARYESIGQNLNKEGGVPGILVKGGAVNLDRKDIRHVISNGVEIHYSGKPLIFENVVFWDCRFVIDNTEPSRKLGEQVLASSDTVSFRSGV